MDKSTYQLLPNDFYIKELDWTEWVLIHPTLGVVHVHDSYDKLQQTPILYGITDNGTRLADDSIEFGDCLTAVEKYEIQNSSKKQVIEKIEELCRRVFGVGNVLKEGFDFKERGVLGRRDILIYQIIFKLVSIYYTCRSLTLFTR